MCTKLTHCWLTDLFGLHRFRKLYAQWGVGSPDGKGAVRSSRATETGKLHFAQSHNFPTEVDYYFHSSQVLWSGGGADEGS